MKAVVLQGKNRLSYEDVPDPQPPHGWSIIRVKSAGLCGSDMQKITADNPFSLVKTQVLGHELSGVVLEVNGPTDAISAGDRVAIVPLMPCNACDTCSEGLPQLCERMRSLGKDIPGGFAENLAVPTENLRRIPHDMSFDLAAITDVVAVAVHTHRLSGTPRGKRVLIIGDGPLALSCIPIYLEHNKVFIDGKNPNNVRIAESMGAQAQEITPESFDIIIESVGRAQSETLQSAIQAAKRGGNIFVTGVFPPGYTAPLNARQLFVKEVSLQGANSYAIGEEDDFDTAISILQQHREQYEKLITHVFPLEQFQRGLAAVSERGISGAIKVVYRP